MINMKNLYLLLIVFPLSICAQRMQAGAYIPIDIPIKQIMPNASVSSGMGLNFTYQPNNRIPLALELRGNLGNYSSKTLEQTYMFDDGSKTVTDVSYSSNYNKLLLGMRFMTGNDMSAYRLYIMPQVGIGAMRSKIRIADPMDEDDCKPLEKRITQRFSGAIYGGEIGLDIDLGRLWSSSDYSGKHRLNLGINYISSFRDFKYVNIKYMQNEVHGVANGQNDENRDITTQFVNVSSNNLHEHKIAELYVTPLAYIGIHIGYVYRF